MFRRCNEKKKTQALQEKQELVKYWKQDIEDYKKKSYEEMTKQVRETGIITFTDDQKDILRAVIKTLNKDATDEISSVVNTVDLSDHIYMN